MRMLQNSFFQWRRKRGMLHQWPLTWVELVYIWYFCVRRDDAVHFLRRKVWINLRSSGKAYMLEIRDDGRGFDPPFPRIGHYGLVGLEERVRQFGCELHIVSAPGEGTYLRGHLPCNLEQLEVYAG